MVRWSVVTASSPGGRCGVSLLAPDPETDTDPWSQWATVGRYHTPTPRRATLSTYSHLISAIYLPPSSHSLIINPGPGQTHSPHENYLCSK